MSQHSRKCDRRLCGAAAYILTDIIQFGPERWSELYKSLVAPQRRCILLNSHAHESDVADTLAALDPALSAVAVSPASDLRCMLAGASSSAQFPQPPIDRAGRKMYYPMDYASVLSAAALNVTPGCSVLDVCAAPGGKSIAISQSLKSGGFLVCNEPDGDRRRRLLTSLKEHFSEAVHARVRVCGHDGTQWPLLKKQITAEGYDRILVDAPCSSDRHLAHSPQQLAQWSQSHVHQAAALQARLLAAAIRCAATGARLVVSFIFMYSTCALSEAENDGAVEAALVHLSKLNLGGGQLAPEVEVLGGWEGLSIGEATRHGVLILPDSCDGWGPLYICCLIVKRAGCMGGRVSSDEEESEESGGDEITGDL